MKPMKVLGLVRVEFKNMKGTYERNMYGIMRCGLKGCLKFQAGTCLKLYSQIAVTNAFGGFLICQLFQVF